MSRRFALVGGVSGFLAVALGAFGAHGLASQLSGLPNSAQRLGWWETAAHYHLAHAVALVALAAWPGLQESKGLAQSRALALSGWGFTLGTLLFSGSLYVMGLTGLRALGAITPLGGLGFLLGWAGLAWRAWRAPDPP